MDDKSKIIRATPLGTEQHIASLNFYTRFSNKFFISGGVVYSRLLLTNSKDNRNIFVYQSSRWDAIPQKLSVESSFNGSFNEGINGGNDDLLNDYFQIDGKVSVEYFINHSLSFKVTGGSYLRQMDYSIEMANQLLKNGNIEDPTFFNGNEYSQYFLQNLMYLFCLKILHQRVAFCFSKTILKSQHHMFD